MEVIEVQIQQGSVPFNPISGFGPQVSTTTITMSSPISQATAILTGFVVEYSGGDDHHLGQLDIQVEVPPGGINGSIVTVKVTYGLRDWSDGWDDRYGGQIRFAVIGE
jgi:hypothetical protein